MGKQLICYFLLKTSDPAIFITTVSLSILILSIALVVKA